MGRKTLFLLVCMWFCVTGPVSWAADGGKPLKTVAPATSTASVENPVDAYRIGPGDVLDISVWKEEAMTKIVTVLPDGMISFPLIGEVRAEGRTVAEISAELKKKISRFVPNPELSIVVSRVNSMLIYVIGRVQRPNQFVLNANIDVIQALAMAGGLTPYAKRDQIKIFRNTGGKTVIFPFLYDEVTDGENLEQNIELKRGDVIVVP